MAASSGKLVWTGRVLSGLVGLIFVMSAVMKFRVGETELEGIAKVGLSESMIKPLAILELACVVLYLIPMTSVLGAVLLTGYMGGAICTHWRVGEPFVAQVAIGVVVWLGLWLREARLRALIPLRTPTH